MLVLCFALLLYRTVTAVTVLRLLCTWYLDRVFEQHAISGHKASGKEPSHRSPLNHACCKEGTLGKRRKFKVFLRSLFARSRSTAVLGRNFLNSPLRRTAVMAWRLPPSTSTANLRGMATLLYWVSQKP